MTEPLPPEDERIARLLCEADVRYMHYRCSRPLPSEFQEIIDLCWDFRKAGGGLAQVRKSAALGAGNL